MLETDRSMDGLCRCLNTTDMLDHVVLNDAMREPAAGVLGLVAQALIQLRRLKAESLQVERRASLPHCMRLELLDERCSETLPA